MMRRLAACAALAVIAAGCGGDDDGLSADQQTAVDEVMAGAEEAGLVIDRGCVEDKAADLSEDDAKKIAEAGTDDEVELSAEGEALTNSLFDCLDDDALIQSLIDELGAGGATVDEACVRSALEGVDVSDAFAATEGGGESSPEVGEAMLAMLDCVGDG